MKYLRKVKKYVDKKTSPENYENACGEDEEDAEAEDMVLISLNCCGFSFKTNE